MNTKLYIVGITLLLFMPNMISSEESFEEQPFEHHSICPSAPLGISFGWNPWMKNNWCSYDKFFMSIATPQDLMICDGGASG